MSSDHNKKIDCIKLLKAIKDNPLIYKRDIDRSWEKVSIIVDASVDECKRKWSELRQGYEKSKSNKYRPYKYLEHIQFIDEYTDKNKSKESGFDANEISLEMWDMSLKDDTKDTPDNDKEFLEDLVKTMKSMTVEKQQTFKKEMSKLIDTLLKD